VKAIFIILEFSDSIAYYAAKLHCYKQEEINKKKSYCRKSKLYHGGKENPWNCPCWTTIYWYSIKSFQRLFILSDLVVIAT